MKVSLCLTGLNQSLLFSRALHWLGKQQFPKDEWELVVVDDNSSEDWLALLEPYAEKLNIQYIRLEHDEGWRDCTYGYNRAFQAAEGEILASTNPHLLLHPLSLHALTHLHSIKSENPLWVSLKGYCITREDMKFFDGVDWREDFLALKTLPNFDNEWTKLWETRFYGSFLCCSFRKKIWEEQIAVTGLLGAVKNKVPGFPEIPAYGHVDPWFATRRRQIGMVDVNIDIFSAWLYHQDHWTHWEMATKWNTKSLISKEGHCWIDAPWWGKEWVPANPNGLCPPAPVPWDSFDPRKGNLPKLRKEYSFMYEKSWAKENAPWLVEYLE